MNQTQRKFLIEKIQSETKKKIEKLRSKKLAYPSASNYVFKAIMNDSLEIQSPEHILSVLKERALKSKEGKNWLSDDTMGWEKQRAIKFSEYEDVIVIPEDYKKERERVVSFNKGIDNEIEDLKAYLNGIEMRIQLSSDSTLKKLINEVDDMGDIKLIDTKVKLLNK